MEYILLSDSLFSCSIDGTIVDTTHLVCLYLLAKLLQAELEKCLRLVKNLPMQDMETYLGKKKEPDLQHLTNILLCPSESA